MPCESYELGSVLVTIRQDFPDLDDAYIMFSESEAGYNPVTSVIRIESCDLVKLRDILDKAILQRKDYKCKASD